MTDTANFENKLLQQFAAGEPGAFATIYKQFYQRIYYFAKTFLPDKQDAEDITADTFVKLWNHRSNFDNINSIGSFLHVTARNSCYDFLRHLKVKTDKQADLLRQIELHDQPELQYTKDELLILVQKEVKNLSDKLRQIYYLSYNEGLSPAQIAESLKLSVQTVSNQKTSLLKILKRALAHATSLF
jgi:RNA polymerase sigma-70 factor (ECF subfamily)